MARQSAHMLPAELEKWMLRMSLDGGDAFSKLRDRLIGTHTVDLNGKAQPLPAVRGMAYDPDPVVRKAAYEAELASYRKIETPMAFCLSCIKGEALTMCEAKGYSDVLSQQLAESRMDHETLDAMWTAIREALPDFRRYLQQKGGAAGSYEWPALLRPVRAHGAGYQAVYRSGGAGAAGARLFAGAPRNGPVYRPCV